MKRASTMRRIAGMSAAVSLLLIAAGCTTSTTVQTSSAPSEEVLKADRLVRYCDRLSRSGSTNVAIGMCARAHELDPDNVKPLLQLGHTFERIGRYEEAADTYKRVLSRDRGNEEAGYRLAKSYMGMGDLEAARVTLVAVAEENPRDVRVMNALGVLEDQLGKHQVAQSHYRRGLKIDPSNVSLRNNLGLSLALVGEGEEAIRILDSVAENPAAGETGRHNLEYAYNSVIGEGSRQVASTDPMAAGIAGGATREDQPASRKASYPKAPSKPGKKAAARKEAKAPAKPRVADDKPAAAKPAKPAPKAPAKPTAAAAPKPTEEARQSSSGPKIAQRIDELRGKHSPVSAKAAPSGPATHTLQVGSYVDEAVAKSSWEGIASRSGGLLSGYSPVVARAEVGEKKDVYYRLRISPVGDFGAARDLCDQLKAQGVDCMPVKAEEPAPEPKGKAATAGTQSKPEEDSAAGETRTASAQ